MTAPHPGWTSPRRAMPASPARSAEPPSRPTPLAIAIRGFRLARGVSQSELQRRIGVSWKGYLSRIERGQRGAPLAVLGRIADALDLSPQERIKLIEAAGFPFGREEG